MKKYILDLTVKEVTSPHPRYILMKLSHPEPLPEMAPGQFAQLRIDGSKTTFLRRPISINYIDKEKNEIWFLVAKVGQGTRSLAQIQPGNTLNAVLPLGRGFTLPAHPNQRFLLVGGGVGTAPLLYLGKCIREMGAAPTFLLGGKSSADLLELDLFRALGPVYITTEDASLGEKGFVTQHSVLKNENFDQICTCGPKPMMVSVARYAHSQGIPCEVSLENKMACGVGACLCCVEKTVHGHQCVCTEGPVFDSNELTWQI